MLKVQPGGTFNCAHTYFGEGLKHRQQNYKACQDGAPLYLEQYQVRDRQTAASLEWGREAHAHTTEALNLKVRNQGLGNKWHKYLPDKLKVLSSSPSKKKLSKVKLSSSGNSTYMVTKDKSLTISDTSFP